VKQIEEMRKENVMLKDQLTKAMLKIADFESSQEQLEKARDDRKTQD
jgi:hypothetical protein